jgi:hypothetical protein
MGIAGLVTLLAAQAWGIGQTQAESDNGNAQSPSAAVAGADGQTDEFRGLAGLALDDDVAVNESAIQQLRLHGQKAVEFLMSQPGLRNMPRWSAVLDAVAQQKDAEYSGLYWHTDLEQALAVAKREKKPVLSLRLLGKLTDELSCANSRFFRTTLYPNAGVRNLLASQFVLHWQSVRAVPVITIDLGNGRQIRRTITGNSLHLVLDERGRPIDVLPGLFASETFVRELQQSGRAALQLTAIDGDEFLIQRAAHHRDRLQALQQTWDSHCQNARLASLPIGIDHHQDVWSKVASLAGVEPVLEGQARRAVVERGPPAEVAGKRAMSKSVVETPMLVLIRNVSRVISEDSVRNEYYLHVGIHKWLASERTLLEREPLVSRVYSELFLSPLDDPWYGLSRPDVFSAIKNDGRIDAATQNSGH